MAASAMDAAIVRDDVARALAEDVGSGDLTAALIPETAWATATIITRENAVVCGRPWVDEVFRQLDRNLQIHWWVREGDLIGAGRTLCTLEGSARHLLTGERTALNFLQTLSGTATITARYVDAVAGTGTHVLDTRKTLPGLRRAQKYAVTCGGGVNHRIGLYDGILIKENHIAAAGSVEAAVMKAREEAPAGVAVEVEVETLEQIAEALESGADILLLDNMEPERLREAVRLNAGRARLEASGGITLKTIRAVAETGVDYISIGALTKDIRAVDLSMRFTG
ncbi:carboxylating nicotinate-nucleotide diphosphorylase [Thiohalomonas denitrificans]|uniref:carboxylating nicotinate-nucleotide diphosphorylase n=1 Tax=Thiohalomonas denitrificans TaxID=415747 RepID=UPI0026F10317|nr:carboxylating nicotinate-nucleotide diphosphorylase [Thiohalomonas denitrificans]